MTKQQEKEYKLEDLVHFTMPNGLLCFMGDNIKICEIVESLGYDMYYVLADKLTVKTFTAQGQSQWINGTYNAGKSVTTTEEERQMAIFKVVKNLIGRSVGISEDHFGDDFAGITPVAHYHLPPIPRTMIKKLDEFFRLVDAKHGTESIVLLTFDDSKPDSSESWGILVPKQENTAVHCKYDPDSIVELKPFNVSIVGSVHSHPGMAAYASGTDHQDQADFDGLHITFGWQTSVNNGATQYHIEMQMAGSAYTLKPEDVFEQFAIDNEPDPEVVKWTENVSKKAIPPYTGTGVSQIRHYPNQPTSLPETQKHSINIGIKSLDVENYISNANLSKTSIVVVELPYDLKSAHRAKVVHCPACEWELSNVDLSNQICSGCNVYIATRDQTASEIIDNVMYHEEKVYQTTTERFTDIYFFCFDEMGKPMLLHLYGNGSALMGEVQKQMELDPDRPGLVVDDDDFNLSRKSLYNEWDEYDYVHLPTGSEEDKEELTDAEVKYYEDLCIDFHDKYPEYTVYNESQYNDCCTCINYYSGHCPKIREMIDEWVENDQKGLIAFVPITPCSEYVDYRTGERLVFD